MRFDNDDALHLAILKDLEGVIDNVGFDVSEEVRDSVLMEVYEPNEPRVYQRNWEDGGFLGSWIQNTKAERSGATSTIFSDPSLMIANFPSHESRGGYDRRENMAAIIAEGTDWDFSYVFNPGNAYDEYWKKPRDYWTPVIRMLDGEDYIGRSLVRAFNKINVTVEKI